VTAPDASAHTSPTPSSIPSSTPSPLTPTRREALLRGALVAALLASPGALAASWGQVRLAAQVVVVATALGASVLLASLLQRRWTRRPAAVALAGGAVATLAVVGGVAQAAYTAAALEGGLEAGLRAVEGLASTPETLLVLLGVGLVAWGLPCGFVVYTGGERGDDASRDPLEVVVDFVLLLCMISVFVIPAVVPVVAVLELAFALARWADRRLGR
jgi:hypothetical protein